MDPSTFYKTFEHTADIGVELEAPDEAAVFTRSALAMFDLMYGLDSISKKRSRRISASGDNLEELLVAWLNEVLFVHAAENLVFCEFTEASFAKGEFSASGWGEKVDPRVHRCEMEIKAATYHRLSVERRGCLWKASIIFDV